MKDYLLISNTTEDKIKGNFLNFISSQVENYLNKKINYKELSPGKAYEWELTPNKYNEKFKNTIFELKKNYDLDFNFIKSSSNRKKKLLVADMDSTIIKEESLDELAKQIGKEKEISFITSEAMNGRIEFKKALIERVNILKEDL